MKRITKYETSASEPMVLQDSMAPPPPPPAMVRTQIYLSRTEYDFLQAESTQRGEPMAAVIRAFIDERMQLPEDAWTNNPMLRPTPADSTFDTPTDAAINHDHYLYGTPKKWIRAKGKWVEAPPLPDDYYENDASYEAYNRRLSALEKAG
jgi:hypothetical protein